MGDSREDDTLWRLWLDLLSAKALVWVARAGMEHALMPSAHTYFFDRYWRLAEYHRRKRHELKARMFFSLAEEHYRAAGDDGPPYEAAMAMPRPSRPTFTNAASRSRLPDPDDAA